MLLTYEESIQFLHRTHAEQVSFLPKKLLLQGHDEAGKLCWSFRPPLLFPRMGAEESLESYRERVSDELPHYIILLLRANGHAAIAQFEHGQMLNHKVIRKYMVRQKQGKSQLKHLKTRGKSRLGSRIRLQQTFEFAQEINQKLWDWETEDAERILVSASIDVWNLLFRVEPLPPFDKRDTRLRKIPYHVRTPNYEELKRIARELTFGRLLHAVV